MDKRIAFKIALCQIASDAGKGIYNSQLINKVGRAAAIKAIRGKYAYKDQLIKELCFDIAHIRKTGFRFWWVPETSNLNRTRCNYAIVYFECKLGNKTLQVSFHNPGLTYKTWEPGSKDFKSQWDEKSSREACCRILDAVKKA